MLETRVVTGWQERYERMAAAWQQLAAADRARDRALVPQWEARIAEMRATQQALLTAGRWRGGPRTLLAALDLQYRELMMTAGLAWLLRPDGHHGLGNSVLNGLLDHLAIPTDGSHAHVRIVREEPREDTRADLVAYGSDWTVVVEAKTFAAEQPAQLDRLYENWRDEPGACFVFLTRGQRDQQTADSSAGEWKPLTWSQVAAIARTAASAKTGIAPGVHDYLATLEAYHRV